VAQTVALMDASVKAGAKAIIIEWNTPGGEVDSGFILAKAIEESPVPVICVVDGTSASMGAYLLQSCKTRIMTKRSSIMMHEVAMGASSFYGHAVKWQAVADQMKATNRAMAEHMARRMTISVETLMGAIKNGAQLWLTWDEAKSIKAVDLVVDTVSQVTDSYRESLEPPDEAI
jgi:ATP-dependent protease ClpP protease subunit